MLLRAVLGAARLVVAAGDDGDLGSGQLGQQLQDGEVGSVDVDHRQLGVADHTGADAALGVDDAGDVRDEGGLHHGWSSVSTWSWMVE